MSQATETFAVGAEQVTVVVEIDLSTVWLISGDFSGTIPSGQIGFINGNVNLTGDLVVEGLLTGIDTFTLTGNGFQILVQNGGQLNLQGVQKSGWVYWGDTPIGWVAGELLLVSPTVANVFGLTVITWNGSWPARPANCPNYLLANGNIAKPEVANLDRSILLNNLSRIHFHDGAGVQTLKWLSVAGSGVTNVLAKYPIHFHLNGESSRGSLLEGVVVRNGKNHAFVPHGSHGITFQDCVAYNSIGEAFWWDPPVTIPPALQRDHTANNSNDILWERCGAMRVAVPPGDNGFRIGSFVLGAGSGNACRNSFATCNEGTKDSAGFIWPEAANQNVGGTRWVPFIGCTSHNNKGDGIFVWQNDSSPHVIEDFIGYRNGLAQIDHGAYNNNYDYKRMVLMGGTEARFKYHSWGNTLLEDIVADGPLWIMSHQSAAQVPTIVRRCSFTGITYSEIGNIHPSLIRYEDCGLTPAKFSMAGAVASSVAEIYEAGVLMHRWTGGSWQP